MSADFQCDSRVYLCGVGNPVAIHSFFHLLLKCQWSWANSVILTDPFVSKRKEEEMISIYK